MSVYAATVGKLSLIDIIPLLMEKSIGLWYPNTGELRKQKNNTFVYEKQAGDLTIVYDPEYGRRIKLASNEALKEAFYRTFTDDPVNWMKWGIVLVIFVMGYVFAIPIYRKICYRISWERKRDIARQRNHIIEASLIDKWQSGDVGAYDWHATYQYSVNGKQKTYRALFMHPQSPPHTLYLYYLNNPNKLFSYSEYHWENHKAVVLLPIICLPWIMAIAAMLLLKIEIPGI